jgi:acetyl esterase/lipase
MAGNSAAILTAQPPPDADARLAYGDSPLQFGDLRLPAGDGPHPLVVVVHGGYWQAIYNLIHAGHLCVDLADHGIATWNVEYRRIGDPGGGYPGTIDDVAAAFAFVGELGRRYPLLSATLQAGTLPCSRESEATSACAASSRRRGSSTCTRPTAGETTRG